MPQQALLTEYAVKGHETPPPTLQELLTLEAHNTTLLALGGPDGNTLDPHGNWWASHPTVLAKALRGTWRWWLRTLLPHVNVENYRELWKKEEKLDLGTTSKATCYIIEVEPVICGTALSAEDIRETLVKIIDQKMLDNRKNKLKNKINQGKKVTLRIDNDILKKKYKNNTEKLIAYMLTKLRYYVLLTTPYKLNFTKENIEELEKLTPETLVQKLVYEGKHFHEFLYRKQPLRPRQLIVNVTLYRRKACNIQIDDLAKRALIYALVIGGIGAATARGFGKFIITRGKEAQQIQKKVLSEYKQNWQNIELTPLPNIDKAVKIVIQPPVTYDILDILAKISEAVRKYEWKAASQRLGLTWRPPYREHGDRYHTWVLGLPRSVGSTGYFINSREPGRWKSPLIFTPIQEDGNWKILLTLFPLKDAEHLLHTRSYQLYWRGKYTKKVRSLKLLSPSGQQETGWSAEDAYRAALEWVTEILKKGEN